MSVKIVIKPNTYFDSVSLMSISTRANKLDGVEQAFVAMATEMNKGVLKNLGLLTPELEQAKNGDLMIVINGKSGADNEQLLVEIEELFNTKAQSGSHEARYATIGSAKKHIPESNLAVISVNGLFAAREARQALQNDLNVMLFSDNVSVEDELALKQLAHEKGLLMMGPDCGTAIINGAALCFGNAVRRGNIGIVGASGTGSQELSVRIHEFGDLVSGTKNSHIATLVDRKSRYTIILRLRGKDSVSVNQALTDKFLSLPSELRKSLTWDRGMELARHLEFTVSTGVKVYFCDPQSPWQRGTNENTNGLIRQYFPKKTCLAQYTQHELDLVAAQLNNRPRKTLKFKTPKEIIERGVALTD
ncbi:IS30 family transposase [Escherichia coli]|uniref:IS30 family transposase n=1 Tax=Escherichia coli TaxID=562 RepID=UPI00203C91EC|nr:IS30 family transposase [Escherichia coli]